MEGRALWGARPRFDVVVVVASLGGLLAFRQVMSAVPPDFPVPIALVQHRRSQGDHLAELLSMRAPLPVRTLRQGALPAAPGLHLVDAPSQRPDRGPDGRGPWQGDEVLKTMAQAYGSRTCAVVLTGRLDDGARGVVAVKRTGGFVVVQAPETAAAAGMPTAAIATGCVDLVLPLRVVGAAVVATTLAPGAAEMFEVPPRPWAQLLNV